MFARASYASFRKGGHFSSGCKSSSSSAKTGSKKSGSQSTYGRFASSMPSPKASPSAYFKKSSTPFGKHGVPKGTSAHFKQPPFNIPSSIPSISSSLGAGLTTSPIISPISSSAFSTTTGGSDAVLGSSVEALDDADFVGIIERYKKVHGEHVPLFVDFYANWCGPCRMLKPLLEAGIRRAGNCALIKVNVDTCPGLAEQFGITSLPTVAAFHGNAIVDKFIGSQDAVFIETFIAKHAPKK